MNKHLNIYSVSKDLLLILSILTLALTSCGDDNDDSSGDNRSNLPRKPVIYMWVSTTTMAGKIGGYSGADSICQREGAEITFPSRVESHRALLSGPGQDARTLFPETDNRPVKRPDADSTLIIDSYAKFFDPSENLENSVGTSETYYFTGLDRDGTPAGGGGSCNDWSSNSASDGAYDGKANEIDDSRLNYSTGTNCHLEKSLLCVSN